ncbi:MAG: YbaB/EbfC family nucleoid-associated protein [Chlamydiia bacterium]|nr:YbaB/EbfC family nucleoid-associated protein [Chlamydiia bacterium]
MGSGFSKKKKQAKQLQQQLSMMQDALSKAEAVGTAGGGLVTVTLGGDHSMKSVKIKPECVDPEDVEGLEDLIKAAYSDAFEKLGAQTQQSMPGLGGGLPFF